MQNNKRFIQLGGVMHDALLVHSKSEFKRLAFMDLISVNDKIVTDWDYELKINDVVKCRRKCYIFKTYTSQGLIKTD